jgi:hypothetical protein
MIKIKKVEYPNNHKELHYKLKYKFEMENNTRKGMISLTKKHGGVSEEHNDYSELNMQLQ